MVTVSGIDDSVVDGNVAYRVDIGSSVSADPAYNALSVPPLNAVNVDND